MDFGKLDENSQRNRNGTGLGLSICKKIIEQMGGSVHVESELGKGTQFIISFEMKSKVSKPRSSHQVIKSFTFAQDEEGEIKNFIDQPPLKEIVSEIFSNKLNKSVSKIEELLKNKLSELAFQINSQKIEVNQDDKNEENVVDVVENEEAK